MKSNYFRNYLIEIIDHINIFNDDCDNFYLKKRINSRHQTTYTPVFLILFYSFRKPEHFEKNYDILILKLIIQ